MNNSVNERQRRRDRREQLKELADIDRRKKMDARDKRLTYQQRKANAQKSGCMTVKITKSKNGKTRKIKHCDLRSALSDKYLERKTQKVGKDDMGEDSQYIKSHGIDYFEEKMLIKEIFIQEIKPLDIMHEFGFQKKRRSYIYIISKKIDDRTFVKIGYSTLEENSIVSSRFRSFQTSLIPGLENSGFKLHYLFFYIGEIHGSYNKTYANKIELDLHDVLRNHENYKSHVIHMPSSKPSEWYLPHSGDYESFFEFVLDFLSVQVPAPEDAFEFCVVNNMDVRKDKEAFFKESSKEEIYKYRKDYKKEREQARVESDERQSKERTLGTTEHFRKVLIDEVKSETPLGKDISIVNIARYNKMSTVSMKYGEYYCYLETSLNQKEVEKIVSVSGSYEIVDDENNDSNNVNGFYTHIFNVLKAMQQLNTLALYGLEENYFYYDNAPIEKAKAKFLAEPLTSNEIIGIPIQDLLWMKERSLKDSSGTIYIVKDFVKKRNDARKAIHVKCVDSSGTETKANIYAVIKLIVDYHENTDPSFDIKHNYQEDLIPQQSETKYDNYSLIKFDSNYFKNKKTNEDIDVEFEGFICKVYPDMMNGKPYMFYDIIFEYEEWKMECQSVDNNSNLISGQSGNAIQNFLENVKGPLKVKSNYILNKLGLKRVQVRQPTRQRSKTSKPRNSTHTMKTRSRTQNQNKTKKKAKRTQPKRKSKTT